MSPGTILPTTFIESLADAPGFSKDAFLHAHALQENITSIRTNPFKNTTQLFPEIESKAVPWCANGKYLKDRPSFTFSPLLHAGAYYVQEASSMFLEQALVQNLDLKSSLKILDLCAAPGGKSTHIQSLISAESFLVSNEVIKTRASILSENITKWGAANVIVSNNDPKDFLKFEHFFDAIIVDAPCSGSGLFRKDLDAISEWSLANVDLCSQRQQRILADAWPALKPNGLLVYSTCSYSKKENEDIAKWLVTEQEATSVQLKINKDWGVFETEKNGIFGYRFYPNNLLGEGFFLSCFRKKNCFRKKHERN